MNERQIKKRREARELFEREKYGCMGKQKHPNEETANHTLLLLKRRKHVNIDNTNVYKCEFCGFYHIGRMKQLEIKSTK